MPHSVYFLTPTRYLLLTIPLCCSPPFPGWPNLPYVFRSGVRSSVRTFVSVSLTRRPVQKKRCNAIARRCEMHVRCPFDGKPHQFREFTGLILHASTCTEQAPCPHVTSLGWLGRSGGNCVKAVNAAWSYRTRPAGQLVIPHPLGRPQILQEGGVGITNLSVWKGLDTTSQWRRIALRLLPCAGGIIHEGRLRAAARSSVLRAPRSGRSYIPVSPVGSARSWRRGQRCLNRDWGLAQVVTDLVPLAHQAHTANW